MKTPEAPSRRRTVKRLFVGGIAFLILFGLFGFLAGPPLARMLLVDILQKQLHRPTTVGDIHINPYALSAEIKDLRIGDDAGGETAGFDRLQVNLASSSIFRGGPVIEEVRLEGPRLRLVREATGRYNVSDLIGEWTKPSEGSPPHFSVNNIQVSGGRLEFDDRPAGKQHMVADLKLALPFISNLPTHTEIFVEPAFSAVIDGAPLNLEGRSRPFADVHESELALVLNNLELPRYAAYAPLTLPFVLVDGRLDADLRLVFRSGPQQPATLGLSGTVGLRQLRLQEGDGRPLLALASLTLPLADMQPLQARFGFGQIRLDALEAHVRVDRDGRLNWLTMIDSLAGPPADSSASAPAAAPAATSLAWSVEGLQLAKATLHWQDDSAPPPLTATVHGIELNLGRLDSSFAAPLTLDATLSVDAAPHARLDRLQASGVQVNLQQHRMTVGNVSLGSFQAALQRAADGSLVGIHGPVLRQPKPATPAAEPAAAPWITEISHAELSDLALRLEDRTVQPAAIHSLDSGHLTLDGFSTAANVAAKLGAGIRINRKGQLQLAGTIQASPPAARLNLDLKGLEVLPLQGYFADRVNLTLTRGQVAAKGELSLALTEDKPLAGGYRGDLTLGNFHSVDKTASEDFLSWKSFHLDDIDLRLSPFQLAIRDVALADFFARIIVSPEGQLNLMQIVRKEDPAAAPSTPAGAPAEPAPAATTPPIRIDQVTLQAGTVSITDHFIKPNYSAELAEIGGRVTGLSSAAETTADIDLRGSYDGAPVAITGKLNPLAAVPSLDLKAEVRGVEMTPFSPYSGKYAGYAIDKGKLSLFLSYKVDQGKLAADNRIFLDQLTFGEKVESPDAIKLPVTLAVSLLKNRRGEIDINLPISGTLSDPEFSVGGIIVQVIVNLLTKAITAPFALLGSLFGGGEELSHVAFAPGRSAFDATALKRLEALAKALDDRPGLKLEITGRVDTERDPEGLRRASLEHKIRAQKLAQTVGKGTEAGSAKDVVVDEKEYLSLLEQAYKNEKFPKPRNFIGLAKSLPREEMEKLMLAHAPAGPEEMRELAQQRAREVADWLVEVGKIPRERIFLLPPKLTADDGGPKDTPQGRVDFSLK
jgi:uncharacterized protein involved in outer membrane biogenesis